MCKHHVLSENVRQNTHKLLLLMVMRMTGTVLCDFESVTEHGIMMTNDLNERISFISERSAWLVSVFVRLCCKMCKTKANISDPIHANDVIAIVVVVADRIQLFFQLLYNTHTCKYMKI